MIKPIIVYNALNMIQKTIVPFMALTTAILSTVVALSIPTQQVYASAQSLEDRVAERRAHRSAAPVSNRIILPKSTSQTITQDRRSQRINQRRLRTVEAPKAPVRSTSLSSLQRRESRRSKRLAGKPVPVKQKVTDGVNMERAKQGVAPLRYQADLEMSAQKHAQDMRDHEYFSHENLEGERSGDRIKAAGYGVINAQECHCSYKVFLGENIAKGQSTVAQVIKEWMESPSHREAMLSKDYKEIGVGIIDDIWVLNFGSVEITPGR